MFSGFIVSQAKDDGFMPPDNLSGERRGRGRDTERQGQPKMVAN